MKIIVTIIPINLVTNYLFILFFSFRRNQNEETIFQQVGGLATRNISIFKCLVTRNISIFYAVFPKIYQIK